MLKLTENDIKVLSEEVEIKKAIDEVTENIRSYNNESDLSILDKLKDFCGTNSMIIYRAKMYRNIGMHHFYRNNLENAINAMQFSIDILSKENYKELLGRYYSEAGLIHFYNREYLYAKMYYDEAEKLLLHTPNLADKIRYLHYYRYGILLSNMQEYEDSKEKFEKALSYAKDEIDIGMTTMNMGVLYKRQKDFRTALIYYSKALFELGDKDLNRKGIIYNNIAEVYKILGQHKKALSYIERAFNYISDSDLSRKFICFNTYTEIKILMGESEHVLDEFLKLLDKVKDFLMYKSLIIEGISNMTTLAMENENILRKLEAAVIKLMENYNGDNKEYITELNTCLENIQSCLKDI